MKSTGLVGGGSVWSWIAKFWSATATGSVGDGDADGTAEGTGEGRCEGCGEGA